jgi:hypothetical protein
LTRPRVTEAGALGAAIIAGVGSGLFGSYAEAIEAMVALERTFEPDMARHGAYGVWFEAYERLGPLMTDYLRDVTTLREGKALEALPSGATRDSLDEQQRAGAADVGSRTGRSGSDWFLRDRL